MENKDSYTFAVALSYAIAAVEKLPKEWLEKDEAENMQSLFERLVPDGVIRSHFLEIARGILGGEGKPYSRPKIV